MKNKILVKLNTLIGLILVSFIIQSCEPAFFVTIKNERKDAIEVLLSDESLNDQNSVSFLRMQNDNYVYRMEGTSEALVYTIVNQSLTTDKFPFDTIHFMTNSDTIELNGKDVIFENFEAENDYTNCIIIQ